MQRDADINQGTNEDDEFYAQPAGGDAACWLHLVCADCGAIINGSERHRTCCTHALDQPMQGKR